MDLRQQISDARKIVVKVGSSSISTTEHRVDTKAIDRIVDAIAARAEVSDVVLVTSGAIAVGRAPLGLTTTPTDLATRQAAASVGQVELAYAWGQSFARHGITVGQVLLTAADAGQRDRARNIQSTISRLHKLGCVPVINENDTVATTEVRFGDNDRLAAIVANLVAADALVLLSDVDGLYTANPSTPGATFIGQVSGQADLDGVVAGGGGEVGTGGMATKVSAAELATRVGIPVLLAAATRVSDALSDASVGTVFAPRRGLNAWKSWALYAAEVAGNIVVDAGAMAALAEPGTSLLAVGITDIDGDFHAGDIVEVHGPSGEILGRGEVNYSSGALQRMRGKHSDELPDKRPVVHADYFSHLE